VAEELLSVEIDGFMSTAPGVERGVTGVVGFIVVDTCCGRNGVAEGAEVENEEG
jgi:hypothetical protein